MPLAPLTGLTQRRRGVGVSVCAPRQPLRPGAQHPASGGPRCAVAGSRDTTGRIFCAPLSAASGRRRMHGRPVGSPETPGKPMRRIFLRGVMAVTEAGGTLTKTVSQHCDGGDDVPTYSIYHRKHGLRLGGLPWPHGRRVRTPRPGPKRPTRTLSRLPGPPPLPKGRGGLCAIRSAPRPRPEAPSPTAGGEPFRVPRHHGRRPPAARCIPNGARRRGTDRGMTITSRGRPRRHLGDP